jgi:hypothetical protein
MHVVRRKVLVSPIVVSPSYTHSNAERGTRSPRRRIVGNIFHFKGPRPSVARRRLPHCWFCSCFSAALRSRLGVGACTALVAPKSPASLSLSDTAPRQARSAVAGVSTTLVQAQAIWVHFMSFPSALSSLRTPASPSISETALVSTSKSTLPSQESAYRPVVSSLPPSSAIFVCTEQTLSQ